MHTDTPITSRENDELSRVFFAREIAAGLVISFEDNNESLVIGLNGPWGSGKSSLLNLLEIEVTDQSKSEILFINFDPWMFSGQSDLQHIFLTKLSQSFSTNKKWSKIKKSLKVFSEKFMDEISSEARNPLIRASLKCVRNKLSKTEKTLQEFKESVDNAIKDSGVKVYITIDDIDRLSPEEIVEIFKMVKLNTNFANTIFILAYDKSIVIEALKKTYGYNGESYIEKIVQIDYTIPSVPHEVIVEKFFLELGKLFSGKEISDFLQVLIKRRVENRYDFLLYLKTIRDIHRLLNATKMRLESIYRDIYIPNFLAIEALRLFEYDAYCFMMKSKSNLLNWESSGKDDEKSVAIETIEKSKCSITAQKIMKNFFDRSVIYRVFSNTVLHQNSVCCTAYSKITDENFDRYFNLMVNADQVTQDEVDVFLMSSYGEKQALFEEMTDAKIFHLIDSMEISQHPDDIPFKEVLKLCLSRVAEISVVLNLDGESCIHEKYQQIVDRILLKIEDIHVCRSIIREHIKETFEKFPFTSFYNMYYILNTYGKIKSSGQLFPYYTRVPLFRDKDYEYFVARVREDYLRFWNHVNDDSLLISIIWLIGKARSGFSIEQKYFLDDSINLERIIEKWESLKKNLEELTPKEQEVVRMLEINRT